MAKSQSSKSGSSKNPKSPTASKGGSQKPPRVPKALPNVPGVGPPGDGDGLGSWRSPDPVPDSTDTSTDEPTDESLTTTPSESSIHSPPPPPGPPRVTPVTQPITPIKTPIKQSPAVKDEERSPPGLEAPDSPRLAWEFLSNVDIKKVKAKTKRQLVDLYDQYELDPPPPKKKQKKEQVQDFTKVELINDLNEQLKKKEKVYTGFQRERCRNLNLPVNGNYQDLRKRAHHEIGFSYLSADELSDEAKERGIIISEDYCKNLLEILKYEWTEVI